MSDSKANLRAISSIRIIGSGLIGTSIGLGLKAQGVAVEMLDIDASAAKLAQDLVGSVVNPDPEVILFAIPVSALRRAIEEQYALNPAAVFIDIASVKTKPQLDVSTSEIPARRFLATHPMAGREVGGAESARADLFQGRSWIYCPSFENSKLEKKSVDEDVLAVGIWIIEALGAIPIAMSAGAHDRAVALISHLPQLTSSLLAAQLKQGRSEDLALSGSGLRDSTRIAASDPDLWSEIVDSNSAQILPLLEKLGQDLKELISTLESGQSIKSFIVSGNQGRALIPGKHGASAREYTQLPVVIEDKPGQLAALFDECAKAEVNIEDLAIEHSPGQFTGLITLSLSASDADKLQQHLAQSGWNVHAPR